MGRHRADAAPDGGGDALQIRVAAAGDAAGDAVTIRRHTLLKGWSDWIWAAMAVCGLICFALAGALRPETPALIALIGAGVGFIGITVRRYLARAEWLRGIAGYTSQGTAVWLDPEIDKEAVTLVGQAIARSLAFWASRYPEHADAMADAFNGGVFALKRGEHVTDRWGRPAHGFATRTSASIAWPPGAIWVEVESTVCHEAAHICLWAAGITGETEAHATMIAAGYRRD